MTEFDRQYQKILRDILQNGVEELNKRTGHKTKIIPGAYFQIDGGFPLLTLRKIPLKIFTAEMIWYLMGSRRPVEFLQKFTRIWDNFTNINGVVTTAYGYRWRKHFGRDQILESLKLLKKDPSSRQAVVVTWDPADDGLTNTLTHRKKMNVPCPYTFVINITAGRLNLFSVARSTDMILGCPHDVAGFALLQRILAEFLDLKVGRYVFTTAHAHVYDNHYQAARQLAHRKNNHPEIKLVGGKGWFKRAEKGDESLVYEIVGQLEKQYRPLPAIKDLRIAI